VRPYSRHGGHFGGRVLPAGGVAAWRIT
jgi:hypothetical protein